MMQRCARDFSRKTRLVKVPHFGFRIVFYIENKNILFCNKYWTLSENKANKATIDVLSEWTERIL